MKTPPVLPSVLLACTCLVAVPYSSLSAAVITGTSLTPTAWYEASTSNYTGGAWTDLSGNNNHALQATVGNQPGFVANATVSGQGALSFDGATDFLSFSTSLSSQSWTVFAVLSTSSSGSQAIISGTTNSLEYRIGAQKQNVVKASVATLATSSMSLAAGFNLVGMRYTDGSPNDAVSFSLNGATDGSGTKADQSFSANVLRIGAKGNGSEFFSGNISALIIFTSALSDAEVTQVNSYLQAKYLTAIPEPATTSLMILLGAGVGTIALRRRLRHRG